MFDNVHNGMDFILYLIAFPFLMVYAIVTFFSVMLIPVSPIVWLTELPNGFVQATKWLIGVQIWCWSFLWISEELGGFPFYRITGL